MNKSSNLFWGAVLVVLGGIFLINSLGIMSINLWRIFWPLMLILFGVWVLLSYFFPGDLADFEGESDSIRLGDARRAKIQMQHGAGKLMVKAGANPDDLVSGTFSHGLDYSAKRDDEKLNVTMRMRDREFPVFFMPRFWGAQNGLNWQVRLTDEIPLDLKIKTGASETHLDLTDLLVRVLEVETGASSTVIHLPDNMPYSSTTVKAGAASVKIFIPEEVAAKIRISGGMMSSSVDRQRFPKGDGYYQSPDYESATHKAEIRVDIGAGSVTVQ